MQFLIHAINRENGEATSPFVVTAKSEEEALAIAAERGVMVTLVKKYRPPPATPLPRPTQAREKYWALEKLSEAYQVIAILNAIGAGILCMYALSQEQIGIVLGSVAYGIISTLTMFAVSQGINLAIDIESHLRAIRDASKADEPINRST
jgi:hypothetical protein